MERFELPEGWEWQFIPTVADLKSGGTPPKSHPEYWQDGLVPFVTAADLTEFCIGTGRTYLTEPGLSSGKTVVCEPGDVLIGTRTRVGNTAIATARLGASQDVTRARLKRLCLPEYFCHFIKFIGADLAFYAQGAVIQGITRELLNETEIPLPPLPEQLRLVTRIEAQTSRVEHIRKAQRELETELRGILKGYYAEICANAEWKPMSEVAPQVRRPVTVQAGQSYPELGIRSFGKGTFHKPAISAELLGTKRLYRIHSGDLIFNNVFAWECAVAVVKPEDAGRVGSHRFITCVPKPGVATTPFLYFHFTTEQGLHDLGDASPGGAGRNRTLGLKNLAAIRVPVPSHDKQVVFARLWDKVESTRRVQTELKADLAAYVPSLLAKAFRGEL